MMIHFVRRNDETGACLANLAAFGRIEADEEDVEASDEKGTGYLIGVDAEKGTGYLRLYGEGRTSCNANPSCCIENPF